MSEPRYIVGIDLGTTHCVAAYTQSDASDAEEPEIHLFDIPQVVSAGEVEAQPLLPSFLLLPGAHDVPEGGLALPWNPDLDYAVGTFARERGAELPARLVASAKSWLCHSGIDRTQAILPWEGPSEARRVSPLEATARYLEHLRDAWNHEQAAEDPDLRLEQQEVYLTVPASFDAVARELTVQAAKEAGFLHLTLLEEPQAAFYAWIAAQKDGWREAIHVGESILVCDVGGGTTDLSLIAVVEEDGNLDLQRAAVGDHILLGGDNMDLALAHGLARELAAQGKTLDPWQMRALTYSCRVAKEQLLGDPDLDSVPLLVPSRGSKLIGGSIKTELRRELLTSTILEGFFPQVARDARPLSRARGGLTQIGLPYAQDAAITRHLAALLGRQLGATATLQGFGQVEGASLLHPTAVLFNGGVFKSQLLAQRTLDTLNGWLAEEGAEPARLLASADLDFAVARGAAYYGLVRQGQGIRIRGGTAQSYYVGIESAMPAVPGLEPPVQALCVAPFGMEEGSEASLPEQQLGLVVGESVRFRFFGSSVRRDDPAGLLLDFWAPDELQELAEIEATLPAEGRAVGEVVPVRLRARITETGTLELLAEPPEGGAGWKVEFEVRADSAA